MAKKVVGQIKLQIPAGAATPAPPVGPALGQAGVNIMDFCKNFNARTAAQAGHDHPGGDHGLRRPQLHLHHQDAAGARSCCIKAAGHRQGLGRAEPQQGRQGDAGAGRGDRQDQAAGPERRRASRRRSGSSRARPARWASRSSGRRRGRASWRSTERSSRRRRGKVEQRPYPLGEAIELRQGRRLRQVRRDARDRDAPGRRPQARRPDGARHGRAAARHSARRCASWSSPAARRSARPRRRAPTTSAARSWPRRSRAAGSTSTPSSPRRT